MNRKQLVVLWIILGLLVAGVVVRKAAFKPVIEEEAYEKVSVALDRTDVELIELSKGGAEGAVRLENKEGSWVLPGRFSAPAQTWKVDNLFEAFSALEGEYRSGTSALFSSYGIAEGEAFQVIFSDALGASKNAFLIGTKSGGMGGSFFRQAGADEVYWVNKDLLAVIGVFSEGVAPEGDYWLDLKLARAPTGDVDSIRIVKQTDAKEEVRVHVLRQWNAAKKQDEWLDQTGEAPFELDASKVSGFLSRIDGLTAAELVGTEDAAHGLEAPWLKVVLGRSGAEEVWTIGASVENEAKKFIKAGGLVYKIADYHVDTISGDVSEFMVSNPLKAELEGLKSVKIKTPEREIELSEEKLKENGDYLGKIRNFSVKSLARDKAVEVFDRPEALYTLSLTPKEGEGAVVDCLEDGGEIVARVRGRASLFMIRQELFEDLFKKLDGLKLEQIEQEEKEEKEAPGEKEG